MVAEVTAGNMHGMVTWLSIIINNEVTAGQIYKAAKTCMGLQGEGGRVHSRVRIMNCIRGALSHCLYSTGTGNSE